MSKVKQTVLDIAMNMNRIGNWIADDYNTNKNKINVFIKNNDGYIDLVSSFNDKFVNTWDGYIEAYRQMKDNLPENAENFMTWGNILTHRSKLLD